MFDYLYAIAAIRLFLNCPTFLSTEATIMMTTLRIVCSVSLLALAASTSQLPLDGDSTRLFTSTCPQPSYLPPSQSSAYYDTSEFRNISIKRLTGAIRFPTVAYDDFGEPEPKDGAERDKRWDTFPPLHDYLRRTYPLV
jgi:Gly-Xaa carboxypeptidase